jgi:hypothetical protein
MKRFHLLGVTLLALFAFGALTAASAFAQPTFLLAEWSIGGTNVTVELRVEAAGELTLKDSGFKASVLCSAILDGWLGPNSLDYVSEVLTLGNGLTSNPLGSVALLCATVETCGATPAPEAWAVNIPWETELELMEQDGEIFFADFVTSPSAAKTVGWSVQCTILGVSEEDECTAASAVSELRPGLGPKESFSPAFTILAGAKLANCTLGGKERGEITGELTITAVEGGEVAATSTG